MWRLEEAKLITSSGRHTETQMLPLVVLEFLGKDRNRTSPTLIREIEHKAFKVIQLDDLVVGTDHIGSG